MLYINGVVEDSRTVGVSGGSCQTVVFTVSKAAPRTYDVSVEGEEGQFFVLSQEIPTPAGIGGPLGTVGIIVIIIVVILLVVALVFLLRRQST